ncbi:MAG: nucleotidyl transferase AbiEii/AbiGii toxin family protein [Prolixibacteraceae bacterium]|jgi:hypothetical protein|nr:nucleotidyl transferase AbiEii/AbiGii toxin family protein [Prolixibacteraceae bacterium]
MNKFYNIPNDAKAEILRDAGERTNLPAYAVEKDWWIVQTLAILFDMGIGKHMVFKGGTSLSKAWGLIERFSEDIDLAVDRRFYGFEADLGKKQRTNLRKKANTYITKKLYPELSFRFKEKGVDVQLELEEITTSDQDPIIILVNYPNVIESPGYLRPRVQVELGCRSLREPFSIRKISSIVDEIFPTAAFTGLPVEIPTVNPERTLLEKIFLLHEEFQRPDEKVRIDRMSRHLYDIYKLSTTEYAESALSDRELYSEIVNHRLRYTRLGGVDYLLHNPQTIHPIPNPEVIEAWKQDYSIIQEQMIYGNSPSFEEMLETIKTFVKKINSLDWIVIP